jgi:hypothetical protein
LAADGVQFRLQLLEPSLHFQLAALLGGQVSGLHAEVTLVSHHIRPPVPLEAREGELDLESVRLVSVDFGDADVAIACAST